MGLTDTILVSYDSSGDHHVLLVGRKLPGQPIEIITAFQDETADTLYAMLTAKQGKELN